jgi:glycosyltransferase involved in cell wall biosynthesis
MKNIAISIVMPVYNNASTLRRALDSVLAQDFEEGFELICAIDPCADGSYEILKEYEKRNRRFGK